MDRVIAFAFVGFVLLVGSDFPATASLAVAFAYLILLAVLMAVGPVAFERIANLFGSTATSAAGSGAGRKRA